MTNLTPAMAASLASWRCVQSHDREGWLALMADDVVVEDPIGQSITNPDGLGVRGKEALATFYDTNIAANTLTITCEETFPSSSPNEVAHILVLRSEFDGGFASTVCWPLSAFLVEQPARLLEPGGDGVRAGAVGGLTPMLFPWRPSSP